MNEIMNINGVQCYEENGTAYLNLEAVARGLGFTEMAASGNKCVRWRTIRKYLEDLKFIATSCDGDKLPDFIPENVFYRLAMKAKNETAEKFQALVADEIIPSIRKHGAYLTPQKVDEILNNPDTIIRLATQLKEEREKTKKLEETVSVQSQQLAEAKPKVSYYDRVLQSVDVVPISVIAKDYGMSAYQMNAKLDEIGVQYKLGDKYWLLHQKYADKGYTDTKTNVYTDNYGREHTNIHMYWTQKGRLFLYDTLKQSGILPMIEKYN